MFTPLTGSHCKLRPNTEGVGKGTLIAMLMKEYPSAFGFSVSHTTRAPRPGEVDGVAYHFTTVDAMLPMIENKEFLESANVHGNLYGTTFAAVQSVTNQGQICVLDIDVQGTRSIKAASLNPSPAYIFIKPPNMEELEKRLRGRGTESEEKIQKRLENAAGELAYADEEEGSNYDFMITNTDLNECYNQLKTVLQGNLWAVKSAAATAVVPAAPTPRTAPPSPPPPTAATAVPAATTTEVNADAEITAATVETAQVLGLNIILH
jgi:guanylate kinase